jgi:integrase
VRADLIDISKLMLATGERIGDTVAVLWEDVSLETAGDLHPPDSAGKRAWLGTRVKSEAGERVLQLTDWTVDMLRARWEPATDPGSPVFPESNGGFGIHTTSAGVCEPCVSRSVLSGDRSWVGFFELTVARRASHRRTWLPSSAGKDPDQPH